MCARVCVRPEDRGWCGEEVGMCVCTCVFMCVFHDFSLLMCHVQILGVRDAQTEITPLTSGGSIPWDGREHWFSSNTELTATAPRPFFQPHTGNHFYWQAKLSEGLIHFYLPVLEGQDEDTA